MANEMAKLLIQLH